MKHRWGCHLPWQGRVTDGWLFHCVGPLWDFTTCALEHLRAHHCTAKLLACAEQQFELLQLFWFSLLHELTLCSWIWLKIYQQYQLFLFLIWLVDPCAAGRQDWMSVYEILNLGIFLCRLPFSFFPGHFDAASCFCTSEFMQVGRTKAGYVAQCIKLTLLSVLGCCLKWQPCDPFFVKYRSLIFSTKSCNISTDQALCVLPCVV